MEKAMNSDVCESIELAKRLAGGESVDVNAWVQEYLEQGFRFGMRPPGSDYHEQLGIDPNAALAYGYEPLEALLEDWAFAVGRVERGKVPVDVAMQLEELTSVVVTYSRHYEELESHIKTLFCAGAFHLMIYNSYPDPCHERAVHILKSCIYNSEALKPYLETTTPKSIDYVIHMLQLSREEGLRFSCEEWGKSLFLEASNRSLLIHLGIDEVENVGIVHQLCDQARKEGLVPLSSDWGSTFLLEASAAASLADLGIDPFGNIIGALSLFAQSRTEGLIKNTLPWASSLMNESLSRQALSDLGHAQEANLRSAIDLNVRSRREGFEKNTHTWGLSCLNEANARHRLAEIWSDPVSDLRRGRQKEARKDHLKRAKQILLLSRRDALVPYSVDWALSLAASGNAGLYDDEHEHSVRSVKRTIQFFQRAREEGLSRDSKEWDMTLVNEAAARVLLARLKHNRTKNLETAIELCEIVSARRDPGRERVAVLAILTARRAVQLLDSDTSEGRIDRHIVDPIALTGDREIMRINALYTVACDQRGEDRLNTLREIIYLCRVFRYDTHKSLDSEEGEQFFPYYAEYVIACLDCSLLHEAIGAIDEAKAFNFSRGLSEAHPVEAGANSATNSVTRSEALLACEHGLVSRLAENLVLSGLNISEIKALLDERQQLLTDCGGNLTWVSEAQDRSERGERMLAAMQKFANGVGVAVDMFQCSDQLLGLVYDLSGEKETVVIAVDRLAVQMASLDFLNFAGAHRNSLEFRRQLPQIGNDPGFWPTCSVEEPEADLGRKYQAGELTLSEVEEGLRGWRLVYQVCANHQLEDLGELFLTPLLEHVPEGIPLIFLPHWVMSRMPLHALVLPDGSGEVLIARNPVAYLPCLSAAEILSRRVRPAIAHAVVFGDSMGDLPGAREEAEAVARVLGDRVRVDAAFANEATKGLFFSLGERMDILHLACHGRYDFVSVGDSFIKFSDGGGGFECVTLAELQDKLSMERSSLVYLALCGSGTQRVKVSDEGLGIVRGFFFAGARSVIASLWDSSDVVATEFAEEFYGCWLTDDTILIDAFRKATLSCCKGRRGFPLDWANFYLVGDWLTVFEHG